MIDESDVQLDKNIHSNLPFQSSLKFQSLPNYKQLNNNDSHSKSILKKPRYKSKGDKKYMN